MSENFYNTKKSVDEYIEMAKDINSAQLIKRFQSFLPKQAVVLELGSGPGTDFQLLKEYFHVVGSDFSKEFLNRLVHNNPKDRFVHLDARSLQIDEKFDGLYSNKVLQHLTDDEIQHSIKRQAEIVNRNGIICHSFWKGSGHEMFKGLLVNYQSETSLRTLFESFFEILLIEEYKEFEDADSVVLIGKKK